MEHLGVDGMSEHRYDNVSISVRSTTAEPRYYVRELSGYTITPRAKATQNQPITELRIHDRYYGHRVIVALTPRGGGSRGNTTAKACVRARAELEALASDWNAA
jgi:hypothetical protein